MLARWSARSLLAVAWGLQVSARALDEHLVVRSSSCTVSEDVRDGASLIQSTLGRVHHVGQDGKLLHEQSAFTGHASKSERVPSNLKDQVNLQSDSNSTRQHPEHTEARIMACVSICFIAVYGTVHWMHHHDIYILPEAVLFIIFGIMLGVILKYWAHAEFMSVSKIKVMEPNEFAALLLLPPLIFESGWSMRRLDFLAQLPYILNFAVLGTLISTYVIATLIYQAGQLGLLQITKYRSALTIAAIISTTDPVATLGTYNNLHVDPLLNIIVFGEAALNDAIAIVVFHVLNVDRGHPGVHTMGGVYFHGVVDGFCMLGGSLLVGLAVAIFVCWSLRVFELGDSKKVEIIIIAITAYLAFAVGEILELSGIISTLCNGMFMGAYARPHLSFEGSILATFFLSQVCIVIEAAMFLSCGVAVTMLCMASKSGVLLGCWLMVFCLIGRLCSTLPCGWLSNYTKRSLGTAHGLAEEDWHLLSWKHLVMIWHAGLRGAISLWLSMHIGDWMDEDEGPGTRLAVQLAILLLIAAFILVFGGTTRPCLRNLDIPMGEKYAQNALSQTEVHPLASSAIKWLDNKVFLPLLVGKHNVVHFASTADDGDNSIDAEHMLRNMGVDRRTGSSNKMTRGRGRRKSLTWMSGSDATSFASSNSYDPTVTAAL